MFPARSSRAVAGLALVWTGLGIICAQYDLAISQWVVKPEASWAAFGQRYGELPGVYAFALAAAAGHARPRRGAAQQVLVRELPWLLCSIGVATALALSAYRLMGVRLSEIEGASVFAVTLAATRVARRWLGPGLRLGPALLRASIWTVWLGVVSWLLVSLLKLSWGRVRYRDLAPLARDFTPWYAPQGWTGHSSFPSGHAALGWLLLPSLLLWPQRSAGYRCAFAVSFAWGLFVASSRVVIGAHYLSDVLFSSALAYSVVAYALERPDPRAAQREVTGRGGVAPPDVGK